MVELTMNLKELKILMDYIKKEHIKYIVRIIETNGKNIIKYNQTIEERKRKKEIEAKLRSYKHYVKKAGTKRKYNLWPEIIIDVFYYHKKNTISKYDLFLLKEAHYCNSKKCIVTKINNGKVSIRCNKCKARNRIPYTKFISLYNNANKLSYEV